MVASSEVPRHLSTSWKATEAPSRRSSPRLCSACDACRQSRVKCTGGNPCQRCGNNGANCHYSVSLRNGRLKANRVQKPAAQASPPYSGPPTGRHGRGSSRALHMNDGLSVNPTTVSPPQSIPHDGLSSCDKHSSLLGPYFATGLNHNALLQVSVCLVPLLFKVHTDSELNPTGWSECSPPIQYSNGFCNLQFGSVVRYASRHRPRFWQFHR